MTVIKGVYKKNIGNCMNNSIRNNLQCLVVAVLEKDQSPPTGLGQNSNDIHFCISQIKTSGIPIVTMQVRFNYV